MWKLLAQKQWNSFLNILPFARRAPLAMSSNWWQNNRMAHAVTPFRKRSATAHQWRRFSINSLPIRCKAHWLLAFGPAGQRRCMQWCDTMCHLCHRHMCDLHARRTLIPRRPEGYAWCCHECVAIDVDNETFELGRRDQLSSVLMLPTLNQVQRLN